jgi:hypothetical protein
MNEAKEKALDLVNKISLEMEQLPYSFCKALAILMVKEIETALENYVHESMELQNMDSEFRYWDKVNSEISCL